MKKILYVDMDNVLVDFPSGISRIAIELQSKYQDSWMRFQGYFL